MQFYCLSYRKHTAVSGVLRVDSTVEKSKELLNFNVYNERLLEYARRVLLVFGLLHGCGLSPRSWVTFALFSLRADTQLNGLVRASRVVRYYSWCAGMIYKCRDNKNTVLYAIDQE